MKETVEVIGVRWYSEGVFELELEHPGASFAPGDCFALFGADGEVSRPYSCASGSGEPTLRFVIRKMPGGLVSGFLAGLGAGDRVKISPPFGWFRPGRAEGGGPFVFFATGTGISPFLAYLRTCPERPPVQCFYGVRGLEDAVELDFIERHVPVSLAVSRGDAGKAFRGRITGLLEQVSLAPGTHYYLCGLDTMIDEVTGWLEDRGVDITQIHRECFFNASYSLSGDADV